MELPAITLPKIDLPFDIPVLLHPVADHFAIVIPVIVLLLEFYNLFTKRKSIGAFSFLLIILMVVVFVAAYMTGSIDGKETYELLSPEAQTELKGHKLLGIYLLFGSVVVLIFKLLAMTGKGLLRTMFFLFLIGFIVVTLKQGKEGGELVYKYGANVEKVKKLDDELFDTKEEIEDMKEDVKVQESKNNPVKKSEPVTEVVKKPKSTNTTVEVLLESVKKEMKETGHKVLSTVKKEVDKVLEDPTITTNPVKTPTVPQ